MDTDIDEALIELYGDHYEVLERSVKALLDLKDDDCYYYNDSAVLTDTLLGLYKEDYKVQACFVAEADRFLRNGNNDAREACLERARKRMSDMRMSYIDSEWKLATEELESKHGVYMRGKFDSDIWPDPNAFWIDLSDGNGTTYAHVCITMESDDLTNDTYASSLILGSYFVVQGFRAVEGVIGFLSFVADDFRSVFDTGMLCSAIVDAVNHLIESHERKCAAKRMYEQFR